MQTRNRFPLPRRAFLQMSAAAAALGLTGCIDDLARNAGASAASTAEDSKLLDFFSKSFTRELEQSPEFMTSLGMKKRYGEWNDYSSEFAEQSYRETAADLDFMRTKIDRAALSAPMRVSYDVFHFRNAQRVANFPFRYHNYDVSHFGGPQQNVPNLLINQHRIDDVADAEAYIARIAATDKLIAQSIALMNDAKAKGITLPRFSYTLMIDDARKVALGAPFTSTGENEIFADFRKKVEKLNASAAAKSKLIADAQSALPDLRKAEAEQKTLWATFDEKQRKAANLEAYRQQLAEIERTFGASVSVLAVSGDGKVAAPAGGEPRLFRVLRDQEVVGPPVAERAAHDPRVSDGRQPVGEGDRAALGEQAELGKLLAGKQIPQSITP